MKTTTQKWFVELTAQETATINGGRRGRGADDGPGHDVGDDKGGRRGGGRRDNNPDGPGHT